MSFPRDRRFRFVALLRVTLVDDFTQEIERIITVEAPTERAARDGLRSIATEVCHDRAGEWFDAPVENVEAVSARVTG